MVDAMALAGPAPADVWAVFRDRNAPEHDGYMYRVTKRRLLERIVSDGVRPQPDGWPARLLGVVTTWWGADLGWVLRYHIYGTVLLRTHRRNGEFRRTAARAPEYVCDAGIAPEHLEYLGADRRWHPIHAFHGSGRVDAPRSLPPTD